MKHCCADKAEALHQLQLKQSGVLKIVLTINFLMFGVEMFSGIVAGSTSLMADSLDMFGDALVYAFSLFVLSKGIRWKARAAIFKGTVMVAFGLGVLLEAVRKWFGDFTPFGETISFVGFLALAANGYCLYLLIRHKDDDINMKSAWLCSRNDVIANLGVIAAGGLVLIFHSKWPDIVVGLVISCLFLRTSISVLADAVTQYKQAGEGGR